MKETIEALKRECEAWLARVKALEAQSKEASHNAEVIQETIRLIKHREKTSTELELTLPPIKVSDKYKGVSMAKAIFDILTNEPGLNAKEIYQRLNQHGYESESKTLQRDVYTRLYRLERDEKLVSTTNDKGKCYSLPTKK